MGNDKSWSLETSVAAALSSRQHSRFSNLNEGSSEPCARYLLRGGDEVESGCFDDRLDFVRKADEGDDWQDEGVDDGNTLREGEGRAEGTKAAEAIE